MSKGKNRSFFDDEFDSFSGVGGSGIGTVPTVPYTPCYESHPVLTFGKGKFYGGSCSSPTTTKADIYIGLDSFMKRRKPVYPWSKKKDVGGPIEVLFEITDQHAPSNAKEFQAMITWLTAQLNDGKTVHAGCIGGHGRTGMVVAALANVMLGEKDAIVWARKNYCPKAVETNEQIEFLHQHYDIKKAKIRKSKFSGSTYISGATSPTSSPYAQYYQDNQGKLPLSSDKYRTKGPRDLAANEPEPLVRATYLRTNNKSSMWSRPV